MSPLQRAYPAGAHLFHRGDPVAVLHLVVSGTVHLVRHHETGGAVILQRARAGSIVAEASLFADSYHCDGVAAEAAETLAVERARVRDAVARRPAVAAALAARLAREVQGARLRAEILSLRTVAERLEAWLAANDELPAKGDWKSLASELGVSPEALYRELAKQRRRGA